jgi:MYXO-CTERM domain-containing protein
MSGRRADPKLHLELLRARGAAERIELSLAMKAISDRVEPLRRAADSVGSIAAALGSGGRPLRWLATAAGALMEARWTRRAVSRAAALLRSGATPGTRIAALGVLAVAAIALLIRRRRRGRTSDETPEASPGDETG